MTKREEKVIIRLTLTAFDVSLSTIQRVISTTLTEMTIDRCLSEGIKGEGPKYPSSLHNVKHFAVVLVAFDVESDGLE
ncbi:hypothetical protein TNCV_882421 [Trichonephila clavipes]|nr:hypothetical protein TNCV_882421 [Trichonephila clavipes]